MQAFLLYSQVIEACWVVLGFLPHFIRNLIFRLMFQKFGPGSYIDYCCYVRYPWRMSVGANVGINRGCEFYPTMESQDGTITIGDNVALGPGVKFLSGGHDYSRENLPVVASPIKVGDRVWIGGLSIILPGVTIGEGAIVGAGSVVTKDVAPHTVVAGNPARYIKDRIAREDT